MNTNFLPQVIDELGAAQARRLEAQARQKDAALRKLGIDEEWKEVQVAFRNLQADLTLRYAEAHRDLIRARNEVEQAVADEDRAALKLDGMLS